MTWTNKTKKNVTVILLIFLLFLIAACGAATENSEDLSSGSKEGNDNDQPYEDGTYTAKGDPWEYGSEDATITIVSGKIDNIILRRLDNGGKEVDYDNWTGQEIDGKTYPNLKEYRKTIADRMIEEQTFDVDSISGATISSDNWKEAVKRALGVATAKADEN